MVCVNGRPRLTKWKKANVARSCSLGLGLGHRNGRLTAHVEDILEWHHRVLQVHLNPGGRLHSTSVERRRRVDGDPDYMVN